jgi:hypothetical protein
MNAFSFILHSASILAKSCFSVLSTPDNNACKFVPGLLIIFCNNKINPKCPFLIFSLAVSKSNNFPSRPSHNESLFNFARFNKFFNIASSHILPLTSLKISKNCIPVLDHPVMLSIALIALSLFKLAIMFSIDVF